MYLQVYISEVACPHLRGRLSSCLKIFSHAGLLSSYLLGAWLDWRQLALVCGAAPLMLLVSEDLEITIRAKWKILGDVAKNGNYLDIESLSFLILARGLIHPAPNTSVRKIIYPA